MFRSRHALVAVACAALAPLSARAQDLRDLKASGKLRVLAVTVSEGPQFMSPAGAPDPGFDAEILAGFARLHGLTVERVSVGSWDALAASLLKGQGDLVAGGYTNTAARRETVDFTVEVFPTRAVVITRRPTPDVTTLAQLRKLRVSTVKGTSMADGLAAVGVKQVDDSILPGGVPTALREGKATAAVDGLESALVATRRDPALRIGLFVGSSESLAYAVRKSSPQLLAALNEYLANLRHSPSWNRLVVKYFGASAPEILRRARE
jgi:ABC-type amino acid transport substrate-binding protein